MFGFEKIPPNEAKGKPVSISKEGTVTWERTSRPSDSELAKMKRESEEQTQKEINRMKAGNPAIFNDQKIEPAILEGKIEVSVRPPDMDEQLKKASEKNFGDAKAAQEKLRDPEHY